MGPPSADELEDASRAASRSPAGARASANAPGHRARTAQRPPSRQGHSLDPGPGGQMMKTTSSPTQPSALAPSAVDLDGLLRRLHLPTIRRFYPEFENRAEV